LHGTTASLTLSLFGAFSPVIPTSAARGFRTNAFRSNAAAAAAQPVAAEADGEIEPETQTVESGDNGLESIARHRGIRMGPRKLNELAHLVRGLSVTEVCVS